MNSFLYLDNAATSFPKPSLCIKEMVMCQTQFAANPGRSAHKLSLRAAERVFATREKLAAFFNIDSPERIIFTQNTTAAVNMALKGYLKKGQNVIISNFEHNSVLRTLFKLKEKGIEYKIIKSGDSVTPDDVLNAIDENTALCCINHVSNVSGIVNDIEGIGEVLYNKNIPFMVDAAQSAGCVPVDVKKCKISLLAFPGHKGLLGPMGTGGLYISENIRLDTLYEGGTGSRSTDLNQPDFLPDRFESGTLNLPGISGLYGSLSYIKQRGAKEIFAHEKMLGETLYRNLMNIKGIKVLGQGRRTGTVSFVCDNISSAQFAYLLDKDYNIAVRAGLHCAPLAAKFYGTEKTGTVRISAGAFNTERDIDRSSVAIMRIIGSRQ